MYFTDQVNLKRTQKKNKNNRNVIMIVSNQRLIRAFVDAIEIHATQTEPYLRWVGSCFSTHVQGNQFSARQS